MTWILVYNRTDSVQPVDTGGRIIEAREFTYADDTDPAAAAAIADGILLVKTITFDPDGSPTGIDPEAFLAAGEVIIRNGGDWEPPVEPVYPYTLAELDALVRTGRLSPGSLVTTVAGVVATAGHGILDIATSDVEPTPFSNPNTTIDATHGLHSASPAHLIPGLDLGVANEIIGTDRWATIHFSCAALYHATNGQAAYVHLVTSVDDGAFSATAPFPRLGNNQVQPAAGFAGSSSCFYTFAPVFLEDGKKYEFGVGLSGSAAGNLTVEVEFASTPGVKYPMSFWIVGG